jgi:hypothetical protein
MWKAVQSSPLRTEHKRLASSQCILTIAVKKVPKKLKYDHSSWHWHRHEVMLVTGLYISCSKNIF